MGARSLVGEFLLDRLTRTGRPWIAVSRGPGRSQAGGRWLQADLLRGPTLPPAGVAFVLLPIWLAPRVVPALADAGVRRLVALSSTSRFTKSASADAGERDVAARLARGEAELADGCAARGLAWTVLRPTLIYAEGRDGNVSRLARLIDRFGFFPVSGAASGLRQPVHADDVAQGLIQALDSAATKDRAFDLPGGETLAYREMLGRIFAGLGRPTRLVSLPPALWRLALRASGPWLPGATAAMGTRMAEDLVFDPGPAREAFGWAPRAFRPVFQKA